MDARIEDLRRQAETNELTNSTLTSIVNLLTDMTSEIQTLRERVSSLERALTE